MFFSIHYLICFMIRDIDPCIHAAATGAAAKATVGAAAFDASVASVVVVYILQRFYNVFKGGASRPFIYT